MIYVCQGHEHSIALEIFLKSFLLLNEASQKFFTLITCERNLETTFNTLQISPTFHSNSSVDFANSKLQCIFFDKQQATPQSTLSLELALNLIDYQKDVLLTLPTSKDQLIINGVRAAGYTEYFRSFFKKQEISMLFSSKQENLLLITDHIPLSNVSTQITPELVYSKVHTTIKQFKKYFDCFDEIIFSGINPHVGENKMLGDEDIKIEKAKKKLERTFPKLRFLGPLSGDTLHFHKNSNKKQLLVYMFHDQGLPQFKAQNGHLGLNITLGLPFLRMSVDHGTAFDLYKKNRANSFGCLYLLKTAIKVQNKIR